MIFCCDIEEYVNELAELIIKKIGDGFIPNEIAVEFLRATHLLVRIADKSVGFYFYNRETPLIPNLYLVSECGFRCEKFRIVKATLDKKNPLAEEMNTELDKKFRQFGKFNNNCINDVENRMMLSILEIIRAGELLSYYKDSSAEEIIELFMKHNDESTDEAFWTYEDLCDYYGCEEDDWPCD